MRIEVVAGESGGAHADGVRALWAAHGALGGDAASQRLTQVLCVLVDDDGPVRGVNSAVAADVPLIGNRRFWIYRRFLPDDVGSEWDVPMLRAAFEALETRSTGPDAPLGVCALVDAATTAANPAAVWPETGMVYAGRAPDGRHLRIRYFDGAVVA